MRSTRHVLALAGTNVRRALPVRSLLQPHVWRAFSSAAGKPPSNPFEINLKPFNSPLSTEKLTLEDAKNAAATQQAEAQHEIDILHDEMSKLFGEEVAEHRGDTSSSVEEAVAAFDKVESREHEVVRPKEISAKAATHRELPPVLATGAARADVTPKISGEKKASNGSNVGELRPSDDAPVDVVLLQGPCSFVRGIWTGGDIEKGELHRQIHALADELNIVVKGRDYYSEKIILQTLLEAREDQIVVLCWNISLSKSPWIVHAVELIQSRVIIVSPSNVEHGPLPANVVGVLSGFWNQSLSLALNAAANILGSNKVQKTATHIDSTKNNRSSAGSASLEKKQAPRSKGKKKSITCYLCGKEGHIRSKCPDLPRNKA